MATILSHGVKIPTTGEREYFDELEDNFHLLNDHKHDGSDSEKINIKHLTRLETSIPAGSWVAVSGQPGTYRQLVTMASDVSQNDVSMKFLIVGGAEDGAVVHPTVEKVSTTTFYAYINDNTLSLKVVYG